MKKIIGSCLIFIFSAACDNSTQQSAVSSTPVSLASEGDGCDKNNPCNDGTICCSSLNEWNRVVSSQGTCRKPQDCDVQWYRNGQRFTGGGPGATYDRYCPEGSIIGKKCGPNYVFYAGNGRCLFDNNNHMYCEYNCNLDTTDGSPNGVSCSKDVGGFARPGTFKFGFCDGKGTCQLCDTAECRPALPPPQS